jgi:hypothetical protein
MFCGQILRLVTLAKAGVRRGNGSRRKRRDDEKCSDRRHAALVNPAGYLNQDQADPPGP